MSREEVGAVFGHRPVARRRTLRPVRRVRDIETVSVRGVHDPGSRVRLRAGTGRQRYTTQAVVSGSVPAPDDGDRRGETLGDGEALAVADDVGRAVAEIEGDDV